MTTSKPYHGHDKAVAFMRPTVGARVYAVIGINGWSENYNRKQADEAIASLLAPVPVDEMLQQFKISLKLEGNKKTENWDDVANFLAAIVNRPLDLIPVIAIVGFWGQLVVLEHQQGTN